MWSGKKKRGQMPMERAFCSMKGYAKPNRTFYDRLAKKRKAGLSEEDKKTFVAQFCADKLENKKVTSSRKLG